MKSETFDVLYKNDNYDLQDFLKNHPGGTNYLKPFEHKDVAKRMIDTYHSKAAFYLLKDYNKNGKEANRNDDLEKLVNWSKPMLAQVGNLGTNYNEWVTSPVDRELRLFGNYILENLTITPWYVVPAIWIPIIIYLSRLGVDRYIQLSNGRETLLNLSPALSIITYFVLGIIIWSLLEYSLHRWIFHIEPSGRSKIVIYFHFAIHGLHHKVPFDTRRLVFPPFPAAIIAIIFYWLFSFILPDYSIVLIFAGALTGYLTYDMIHYYLHYGSPKETSYFYELKRYHNQHHFAHHDLGFGISSVIWDKIFGTAVHLKKLKIPIKW
ncbi:hypothetical protein ABEB36_003107 [Hypothenemus hampei]|uniref:Fatty acid 2-hydroxylase n=1 Tax=Hypothenemus hampei TaxID=57062 RepID=A0ABD1F815_HYPHA